jgi:putative peptidoglycan lipid II flippase
MFSFLNTESKTIMSAAAIVGVLSFASRLVGLIRDRVLAGLYGAGNTLDVYYAAFKVPDVLFNLLVVGALSASFIPLFTKYYYSAERRRAWEITNNVLHILLVTFGVLAVIAYAAAGPLAALIAPGFAEVKQLAVAEFTRVMLLASFILAVSMVFGSALQGMKRFFLYALAPIFYNVGIIVGALWFTQTMGPIGLAWGVVLGAALHAVTQIIGAYAAGYRHAWRFHLRDAETRQIFRLMGPRVLALAVSQIHFVALGIIASTLAVGSVTVFQFAYNIQFFPVGIIGVSFAIAAFPSFAEHLALKGTKKFVALFATTVRQVLFFMIPLTLLFLILRAQVVRVVVGAGAFDWTDTILTADTLAFFTLSLASQALVYLLARAFFALHDTWTPLVAGVVSVLTGVMSSLYFTQTFGVVGLGMAFSLSALVNLALLWIPLRSRLGTLGESTMIRPLFVMSIAGMAAGVVMQLLKSWVVTFISLNTFWGVFYQGLIAGGIGLLVYVGVAYAFGNQELLDLIHGARRRFLRRYHPEETIAPESPTAG